MTQHTPGPWYLDGYADDVVGSAIIRDATGFQVALTRHWGINETEANARLIAAAPDLLEALRGVAVILNATTSMHQFDGEPWVRRVREAIAKATGENLQKSP